VLVWPPFGDCEVTILRAPAGGEPTEIARVTLGTGHYLDAGLAPLARYEYTVRPAKGDALGPVPASNSPEMLVGGDFEGLEPGETTSTPMFHRAYGPPWWDVVELARPGGEGKLALKIRHGTPPRRDGLHSRLLPVDPRGAYRQTGWQRVLPGGSGRIGRQILTRDMKAAGGRIVPYSYAPVLTEEPEGWEYYEQRLSALPKDAAYLQVWALAFNTGNTIWFDDLSLIDETTERLFGFDADRQLPELIAPANKIGDAEMLAEAGKLAETIKRLDAELASPRETALEAYLDGVYELNAAIQRAKDLAWDLRILGLAK